MVTDHKSLVMIFQKPLHAAPPHLQRMILKVQGYNFTMRYCPGEKMTLSDTLSRLPNSAANTEVGLDQQVGTITMTEIN